MRSRNFNKAKLMLKLVVYKAIFPFDRKKICNSEIVLSSNNNRY